MGTEAVSGSVKTPELREVVTNQLSDEQRSSLETYREVTSEISQEDWDEFSERWEETEARFDSITDEISQLTGNTEFIDPKYEGEINAIIEQRPALKDKLGEIAGKLSESDKSKRIAELEKQQAALASELVAFESIVSPWSMPQIIDPSSEGDSSAIDTFPDDKLNVSIESISETMQKKFIDKRLTGASARLADVFASYPDQAFTLNELATVLYGGDKRTPEQRVVCVASLISAHERSVNSIIMDALSDSGLVLQRGKRQIINPEGKIIRARMPIFRAVTSEKATKESRTVQRGYLIDGEWVNERARKANLMGTPDTNEALGEEPEDVVPRTNTEKQFTIYVDSIFKDKKAANLIDDIRSFEDGVLLSEINDRIPMIGTFDGARSLGNSKTWKKIMGEADWRTKRVSAEDIILMITDGSFTKHLSNAKNHERSRALIRRSLEQWDSSKAIQDIAKVA